LVVHVLLLIYIAPTNQRPRTNLLGSLLQHSRPPRGRQEVAAKCLIAGWTGKEEEELKLELKLELEQEMELEQELELELELLYLREKTGMEDRKAVGNLS